MRTFNLFAVALAAAVTLLGGCAASDGGGMFINRVVVEREAGLLDANLAVAFDTMSYEPALDREGNEIMLRKIIGVFASDSTVEQLAGTAESMVNQMLRKPDRHSTIVSNGSTSTSDGGNALGVGVGQGGDGGDATAEGGDALALAQQQQAQLQAQQQAAIAAAHAEAEAKAAALAAAAVKNKDRRHPPRRRWRGGCDD